MQGKSQPPAAMDGQDFVEVGNDQVQQGGRAPVPDPDAPVVCGPRPRDVSSAILAADGSNYLAWKTIIPSVLGGEPYAWDVVSSNLNPPDAAKAKTADGKTQQKNFTIGNNAARYVLINSIQQELAVELFESNAETVKPRRSGEVSRTSLPRQTEKGNKQQ